AVQLIGVVQVGRRVMSALSMYVFDQEGRKDDVPLALVDLAADRWVRREITHATMSQQPRARSAGSPFLRLSCLRLCFFPLLIVGGAVSAMPATIETSVPSTVRNAVALPLASTPADRS